uniref:Uncharacterized protein n=1 Tax=Nelumbo nucifera TaxID=4432 RepID=A0A822Z6G2_NELNU|nr:TPA_asm: hypothetical protein HUJ06_013312 [Nelumbo nucifera]
MTTFRQISMTSSRSGTFCSLRVGDDERPLCSEMRAFEPNGGEKTRAC